MASDADFRHPGFVTAVATHFRERAPGDPRGTFAERARYFAHLRDAARFAAAYRGRSPDAGRAVPALDPLDAAQATAYAALAAVDAACARGECADADDRLARRDAAWWRSRLGRCAPGGEPDAEDLVAAAVVHAQAFADQPVARKTDAAKIFMARMALDDRYLAPSLAHADRDRIASADVRLAREHLPTAREGDRAALEAAALEVDALEEPAREAQARASRMLERLIVDPRIPVWYRSFLVADVDDFRFWPDPGVAWGDFDPRARNWVPFLSAEDRPVPRTAAVATLFRHAAATSDADEAWLVLERFVACARLDARFLVQFDVDDLDAETRRALLRMCDAVDALGDEVGRRTTRLVRAELAEEGAGLVGAGDDRVARTLVRTEALAPSCRTVGLESARAANLELTRLERLLRSGWTAAVAEFETETEACRAAADDGTYGRRVAKERVAPCGSARETLEALGAARETAVRALFACYSAPDQHVNWFGSKRITSDLDASVAGRGAFATVWSMFRAFAERFDATMPFAFDTNLYANGLYTYAHARRSLPPGVRAIALRGDLADTMFVFGPDLGPDIGPDDGAGVSAARTMRAWALAKVVQALDADGGGGVAVEESAIAAALDAGPLAAAASGAAQSAADAPGGPSGRDLLRGARALVARQESARAAVAPLVARRLGPAVETGAAELGVSVEYALQCYFARAMERHVYEGVDEEVALSDDGLFDEIDAAVGDLHAAARASLVESACLSMFHSVEAAYTQATVNVVVQELQNGAASRLSPAEYAIAAIETLGDLLTHVPPSDDPVSPARVVAVSKYVYRATYAAARARPGGGVWSDADAAATRVRDEVVSLRGSADVSGDADLSAAWYVSGMTGREYRAAAIARFADLALGEGAEGAEYAASKMVGAGRSGRAPASATHALGALALAFAAATLSAVGA